MVNRRCRRARRPRARRRRRRPRDAHAPGRRGTRPGHARDEADVHALGLVRGAQPERRARAPHLGLGELADREQRARELALGRACRARTTGPSPRSAPRASAERRRASSTTRAWWPVATSSKPELRRRARAARPNFIVRLHSTHGFGVAPGGVRVDVGRRRRASSNVVGEVEDVVRDVELRGDAAGVLDVGHAAAAGVGLAAPQLERDAGDVVALRRAAARPRPTSRPRRSSRPARARSCAPAPRSAAARRRRERRRARRRRRRRSTRSRG